jgi:hypothetical protein
MTEPRSGTPDDPRADEELDEEPTATDGDAAAVANADELAPVDEEEAEAAEEAAEEQGTEARAVASTATAREARRDRGRDVRRTAAPSPSEQAVHIDDRISKWFVAAAVVVFVLIFLNGMLLGRGGALSPAPTPSPTPATTATPAPTASASASASTSASTSPAATATPTPTP